MQKRLIAVPLLCGALLSLAACGNYAIPDFHCNGSVEPFRSKWPLRFFSRRYPLFWAELEYPVQLFVLCESGSQRKNL